MAYLSEGKNPYGYCPDHGTGVSCPVWSAPTAEAVTLAERGSAGWWLHRWGDRAEQDAGHSRERAEYLALCHRDVLHAGDDGTFDDDGSWEDDSALLMRRPAPRHAGR